MNHSLTTSAHSLPPFPSFPPSPPSPSSPSSPPLLHFHPPTSAPHLYLHPDHLTASHSGPGHHSQDHTVLHTHAPLTFPAPSPDSDEEPAPSLAYFEVQLLDAGKKGELFVGLINAPLTSRRPSAPHPPPLTPPTLPPHHPCPPPHLPLLPHPLPPPSLVLVVAAAPAWF